MTHRAGERDVAPARPNVETTRTPRSGESGTPRRSIERLAGGPDLPDLDLLLVVAIMAIAVVAAFVGLPAPLRLPIALPAAILLPGYAIGAALFPPGELDAAERAALSFGLSLALVVVAAPVINLTVPGLTAPVVVSFVAAVTWGSAGIALLRRRRHPGSRVPRPRTARQPAARSAVGRSTIGVAVVAIALCAYLVLRVTSPPTEATELSLIGPDGAIASVPATVVVGMPVELTVRIASHEPGAQPYRIVVSSDGRRLAGRDGIVLDDGASQDETIRFGLATAGPGQVVRVELYRGEEAAPYRALSLVFDVVQPGQSSPARGESASPGADSSASPGADSSASPGADSSASPGGSRAGSMAPGAPSSTDASDAPPSSA